MWHDSATQMSSSHSKLTQPSPIDQYQSAHITRPNSSGKCVAKVHQHVILAAVRWLDAMELHGSAWHDVGKWWWQAEDTPNKHKGNMGKSELPSSHESIQSCWDLKIDTRIQQCLMEVSGRKRQMCDESARPVTICSVMDTWKMWEWRCVYMYCSGQTYQTRSLRGSGVRIDTSRCIRRRYHGCHRWLDLWWFYGM